MHANKITYSIARPSINQGTTFGNVLTIVQIHHAYTNNMHVLAANKLILVTTQYIDCIDHHSISARLQQSSLLQ